MYPFSSDGNMLRLCSSSSFSSEENRLRIYSSSEEENWQRLYSSATTWSRFVSITTPDQNRATVLYLLDGDQLVFKVPSGRLPEHFMPWVHPFASVISGPTGSEKSVFVRIFVHNIRHMMTPIPDHILWCYEEYQTLYGTVDGVGFQ